MERENAEAFEAGRAFVVQTRACSQVAFQATAIEPPPARRARELMSTQDAPDAGRVIEERWNRVRAHQRADPDIGPLIQFLEGDLDTLSVQQARTVAKIADDFEVDAEGVLRYAGAKTGARAMGDTLRLVVPPAMREDVLYLHLYHDDLLGGRQGVTRTFERIKSEYYWRGLCQDVERHVRECIDCLTSKGTVPDPGTSYGNVEPDYSMQIISMDFVPESRQGNIALLLFQDMFSGYVMCKAMRGTTAQEVAEAYEEVAIWSEFDDSTRSRPEVYERHVPALRPDDG